MQENADKHWIALQSRMLAEMAYDARHATLYVRLKTGKEVRHDNIAPQMVENLRTAESPGFYYSYYIAVRPTKAVRKTPDPSISLGYALHLLRTGIARLRKSRHIRKSVDASRRRVPRRWLDQFNRRVLAAERFLHIR